MGQNLARCVFQGPRLSQTPVKSFSLNCPPVFTTPRAAQDKLVEMGPHRFGWVLGITQLLQVLIKMGERLRKGWGPQGW